MYPIRLIKHLVTAITIPTLLSLALTTNAAGDEKKPGGNASPTVFSVRDLLKNPESHWNQTVVFEGLVTQVCPRSGKKAWLHDLDPDASGLLRVERTGSLPAFGRELEGKTLRVTGTLRELRIDTAYLDSWEARIKGPKTATTQGDACTEKCEENQSLEVGLKRIRTLREQLAKSQKDHLSALWVDGETWELKATKNGK